MNFSEGEGRRTFLAWMSGSIAAAIGLVVGIPLVGYTILPALKRREAEWNDVGTAQSLQPGIPKEMACIHSLTDGWQKTTTKKSLWAVKDDAGAVTVYPPICTHLGCGYRWRRTSRSSTVLATIASSLWMGRSYQDQHHTP